MKLTSYLAIFLITLAIAPAQAQSIVRKPYLQLSTTNSVVIRWRTDELATAVVRWGKTPGEYTRTNRAAGVLTEQIVRLSGLEPDTRYYYSVGATNKILAGGDAEHYFVTAPLPGKARPTRIWVIGDPGTANTNQMAVRDAYYNYTKDRRTDVWLMLGDNAYSTGTDKEYQRAVFNIYETLLRQTVLWPTLGNHDAGSASSSTQSGVYYDSFTLPTLAQAGGLPSGTEAYYSFDYANIHFVCLDSHDTDRSPNGAMLTWLKQDLAMNKQDWLIAFWHHPPYTKGSHDSDKDTDSGGRMNEMRANALPILEAAGVDLVLTGHSHSYERSYLIDGHYGKSPTLRPHMLKDLGDGREDGSGAYRKPTLGPGVHEGAVYAVAGSSGQISGGKLNHPVKFISLKELGSMVLDVEGDKLDAVFINEKGERRDHFTLLKGRK